MAALPKTPRVSILILSYNGADLLGPCLESLRGLAYPDYEIVVIDNGSTDDTPRILAQHPAVRTVRTEKNLGSSGGYNFGLPAATGEFVLMMNNDMIANPLFVSALSSYLVEHPEVGIVQGKMVLPRSGGTLEVCGAFMTCFGLLYNYGYFKPDGPKYEQSQAVFCGKGACLMFRREVVEAAGGYYFNPEFHCYYEETDLCHRAWLAGYETHFVASPAIQHLSGVTVARSEKAGFAIHYFLRNMIYSLLTILEWPWILRLMPIFISTLLFSMTAYFLTGQRSMAAAHWNALAYNLRHWKKIRARRTQLRAIRKKSDGEIFAKVLRTPRLEYFFKTFTGRLADYED